MTAVSKTSMRPSVSWSSVMGVWTFWTLSWTLPAPLFWILAVKGQKTHITCNLRFIPTDMMMKHMCTISSSCSNGLTHHGNSVRLPGFAIKLQLNHLRHGIINMSNYVINKNEFVPSSLWSVSNALHMMKLSYAVYAGTTDIEKGLPKEDWGITERLVNAAGYDFRKIEGQRGLNVSNAMVCSDENTVFLVFRGTEPASWRQWATDANTIKAPFAVGQTSIGKAHSGFLSQVDLIWEKIVGGLKEVGRDNRPRQLFVGGHSLGAGMSQIACAKLWFEDESLHPTAVYNFGCPRALNPVGAGFYNERFASRTYRVVNNNDIVCKIPLKKTALRVGGHSIIGGFSHVGQLRYITADGKLLDKLPAATGFRRGLRRLAALEKLDFAIDHLPDHYIASLSALRD